MNTLKNFILLASDKLVNKTVIKYGLYSRRSALALRFGGYINKICGYEN